MRELIKRIRLALCNHDWRYTYREDGLNQWRCSKCGIVSNIPRVVRRACNESRKCCR